MSQNSERVIKAKRPCRHCGDEYRNIHRHCVTCYQRKMSVLNKRNYAKHITQRRDAGRRRAAERDGFALPPLEKDCPPRPADSRCHSCGNVRPLVMDHDHVIGHFRGWICDPCNRAIGLLGDTFAAIEQAYHYMAISAPR